MTLVVDHLLLGAARLEEGMAFVEDRLGVAPAVGGKHARWGTHNALVSLGEKTYLEVIAPDPEVREPAEPRPFGIGGYRVPRLATWVARGTDLEKHVERARALGLDLGAVAKGTRRRSDDVLLEWRMTDLAKPREGGVVPFLIDWGTTPHPAASAPGGCRLASFRVEHPEAERITSLFASLGIAAQVLEGSLPALVATIASPRGTVELR